MLTISSPEFNNNETIPSKFTGEGIDISPALIWTGVPLNAKSLAIIMDDPDAPSGSFIHWVIFNIPSDSKGLPEAVHNNLKLQDGALQGENSARSLGYYGPYPPVGPRHRYQFHIYALDSMIDAKAGASKKQVLEAMQGHIIESSCLTGIYQRTCR